jgi:hypothetical protein
MRMLGREVGRLACGDVERIEMHCTLLAKIYFCAFTLQLSAVRHLIVMQLESAGAPEPSQPW